MNTRSWWLRWMFGRLMMIILIWFLMSSIDRFLLRMMILVSTSFSSICGHSLPFFFSFFLPILFSIPSVSLGARIKQHSRSKTKSSHSVELELVQLKMAFLWWRRRLLERWSEKRKKYLGSRSNLEWRRLESESRSRWDIRAFHFSVELNWISVLTHQYFEYGIRLGPKFYLYISLYNNTIRFTIAVYFHTSTSTLLYFFTTS